MFTRSIGAVFPDRIAFVKFHIHNQERFQIMYFSFPNFALLENVIFAFSIYSKLKFRESEKENQEEHGRLLM